MVYNIFGSAASFDVDILVPIPAVLPKHECQKISRAFAQQLAPIYAPKKVDINVCTLTNWVSAFGREGIVRWTCKGTADEVNNSVLATYHLHEQKYALFITRKLPRDVPLKMTRGIRDLLGLVARDAELRVDIKNAMRANTLRDRLDMLRLIQFSSANLGTKDTVKVWKDVAFQLAQMLGLLVDYDLEIYTKEHAAEQFPSLGHSLERGTISMSNKEVLDHTRRELINLLDVKILEYPGWALTREEGES
jgi:hypothetical protein